MFYLTRKMWLMAILQLFSYGVYGTLSYEDNATNEGDICVTKSGSSGECIAITECGTLSQKAKTSAKICSWKGSIPVICCPLPSVEGIIKNQVCGISYPVIVGKPRVKRDAEEVHVVGGKVAIANSWPWMVSLRQGGLSSRHRCGGCIIDNYHVLTAAHCFVRNGQWSASDYTVRAGGHTRTDGIVYTVAEVMRHPGFRIGQHYNDIAIVKVETPFVFGKTISPACLPSVDDNYTRKPATVVGWGDTSFGGIPSQALQEATVPVIDTSECDKSYRTLSLNSFPQGITSSLLCAGVRQGGKDSCQGDSGGPLLLRDSTSNTWKIIGVVSFGYNCGAEGYPGVYTKVSSYRQWIDYNTNS